MVSLVKTFIFYCLIKQSELYFGAASPIGAPPNCGQYGFRCTNSHEYQLCVDADDGVGDGGGGSVVDTFMTPAITHPCPKDMLCDEDNESYCSLPDDERDSIILMGTKPVGGGCQSVIQTVRSSPNSKNPAALGLAKVVRAHQSKFAGGNLNIQRQAVANFRNDGEVVAQVQENDDNGAAAAAEMCITPPAPFDCDMLGYFAGNVDGAIKLRPAATNFFFISRSQ